jgi:nicotinamidase-related amidase
MSYDRLTSENAAVLLVDHQTGLSNGVHGLAVEQQPKPQTVALLSADAEFSRNPILGRKPTRENTGFGSPTRPFIP